MTSIPAAGNSVAFEPDLDRAVERCETALLEGVSPPEGARHQGLSVLASGVGSDELSERFQALLVRQRLPAGTTLIRQGQHDGDLYLLEAGTLSVVLDGGAGRPQRVRRVLPGALVGEIGFYLKAPRTADVIADGDVVVARLPGAVLAALDEADPELAAALHRALAHHLADRLATTLRTLRSAGS